MISCYVFHCAMPVLIRSSLSQNGLFHFIHTVRFSDKCTIRSTFINSSQASLTSMIINHYSPLDFKLSGGCFFHLHAMICRSWKPCFDQGMLNSILKFCVFFVLFFFSCRFTGKRHTWRLIYAGTKEKDHLSVIGLVCLHRSGGEPNHLITLLYHHLCNNFWQTSDIFF